ncbi:unnamed protein product [Acanthoscelides obtectus]|uniref:BED-type domain-containing protein n=1 Tax=Acanthoscelides obtectus TaxID=200917 RepID=A0A9P0Q0V3_ACAOB|nr:unnamed protein product [Acanthoscelides obtectus]CAK1669088.1 hypothetical protein AOBTE_LOCUS26790 [Acanthoscelides obtectus]
MHFTNISEANAKSNLCKNIYSHKSGNISNLRKHLKTKHPTFSLEGERAKRRVEKELSFSGVTRLLSRAGE